MKQRTIHTSTVRALALTAGLSLAMSAKATLPTSSLPDFDNLPNFGLLGNQLFLIDTTVNGNAGVSENGELEVEAPSTVNGDVSVANGATLDNSGHITGTTSTGQDLITEQNTVYSASEALDALTPDQTISGDLTSEFDINVAAGQVYVLNVEGGLELNNENIQLTGGGNLVINLESASFDLEGTASILGNASNIFINYLGTGTIATTVDDVINAQVFVPNGGGKLAGTWNGAIYGGIGDIDLQDGSTLNAIPIPEPGTLLVALGGISIIILGRRLCSLKSSV